MHLPSAGPLGGIVMARKHQLARPLYEVFLERVINIPAVQCHRAAALGDYVPTTPQDRSREIWNKFFEGGHRAKFFSEGSIGDFLFSLDASKAENFPWDWKDEKSVSLPMQPMQHALEAAADAFEEFIKALKSGEFIASAVHPATGARYDLDRAEWVREWLILDVRNGDLIQVEANDLGLKYGIEYGKKTVRWTALSLRVGEEIKSSPERGDRDGTPTRHFSEQTAARFAENFIRNEEKAKREPTLTNLEEAARNEGYRGAKGREHLRDAFRKQRKAAGHEVKQGRRQNPQEK
jgi:hypothetical protein